MLRSLVGSEMCIRDRHNIVDPLGALFATSIATEKVDPPEGLLFQLQWKLSLIHI